MRRADKSDIVTAFCLKFEHHFGKPFVRDFVFLLRFPGLRNLEILTIDAAQIAVAEKYISRAARSRKTRFFAEMRRVARHNRQSAGITGGDFVQKTIVAAILRADAAGGKQIFEFFNSPSEFAACQ